MIKRRTLISTLGSAVATWPLSARTQQGERMRRIGILMPYSPGDAAQQSRVRVFREELRKKGWASGVNVQFDERWTTDNIDLIRSAVSNLVELKPDAILATGGRVIPIVMQTTRSIPIVVPAGVDPVEQGYAKTLARPGGNVTGFTSMETSVIGKVLQILKDIAPQVSRVAYIGNPDNNGTTFMVPAFQSAAGPLGIESVISPIHGLADIERAIAAVAAQPNGGLYVPLDLTISALAEQTVTAAAQHRLPAVYSERLFATKGGLVSYGVDRADLYRNAAAYVDRILRGEKPGDLPYQQPTKYELVINRKTANALGLDIPMKLLVAADEVIE